MMTITEGAVAYIKSKGGVAYIDLQPRIACCAGSLQEPPTIRFGKPRDDGRRYTMVEIDGIQWFLPSAMMGAEVYTVTLHSFLGIQSLGLEGWNGL